MCQKRIVLTAVVVTSLGSCQWKIRLEHYGGDDIIDSGLQSNNQENDVYIMCISNYICMYIYIYELKCLNILQNLNDVIMAQLNIIIDRYLMMLLRMGGVMWYYESIHK